METPPDPQKKPTPPPELDAFEAAAAAAERALSRIHERAEAVEEKFGMTEPAPEFWVSKGDIGAEGGVSSTLIGTAVSETGTFELPLPPAPEPAAGPSGPATGSPSPEAAEPPPAAKAKGPGKLARSTAFFSIATAASRVAGLAREVVAASYFGISGPCPPSRSPSRCRT